MPRRSEYSSDVEVIEDSEPERVERRSRAKLEKERLIEVRKASEEAVRGSRSVTTTQASTSRSLGSVVSGEASQGSGALESQVSIAPPPVPSSAPTKLARKPAPPPWLASKAPSTQEPPTRPAPTSPTKPTKASSQPSPVKQLDLNVFAFQKRPSGRHSSRSTSRTASSSKETPLESCSDVPKVAPGPVAKATSPKTFHLSVKKQSTDSDATFTTEQISSLNSCVVCGNAWTVRKLAKSKWSHITSCARKQGCGLDTLQLKLVAAIVDASELKATKSGKGKAKEKEPAEPQTLLAHTVQEHAPPKRRGRRKDPGPSSLQPVEDARNAILERGRALLGAGSVSSDQGPSQDVAETTPTQPEVEQEVEDPTVFDIPATQNFAPSKIAGRSRFFGSTIAPTNTDSRSGLFYADLPCALLSPTGTRSLSSFQLPSSSNVVGSHVLLPALRSTSPALSTNSSIISINSSNDSELDHGNPRTLNRLSPPRSDSSASIIVLNSPLNQSCRMPASPLESSPVPSYVSSPVPPNGRLDYEEPWNSQAGVFMWDDYVSSPIPRPPSPTESLAEYLYEMSLRDDSIVLEEQDRGRSWSPHPLILSSNSKDSSKSSSKRPKLPTNRTGTPNKRSRSRSSRSRSKPGHRNVRASSPGAPLTGVKSKSKPVPKSKAKSRSKSRSRSSSQPRSKSPKRKKKRSGKKDAVYASEDIEGGASSKDLDAKLLKMITSNESLYLRILRYEPIKFEDILNMAVERGVPKHGLQNKLKAFLDSQCINFYSEEALGRRKKRHG